MYAAVRSGTKASSGSPLYDSSAADTCRVDGHAPAAARGEPAVGWVSSRPCCMPRVPLAGSRRAPWCAARVPDGPGRRPHARLPCAACAHLERLLPCKPARQRLQQQRLAAPCTTATREEAHRGGAGGAVQSGGGLRKEGAGGAGAPDWPAGGWAGMSGMPAGPGGRLQVSHSQGACPLCTAPGAPGVPSSSVSRPGLSTPLTPSITLVRRM